MQNIFRIGIVILLVGFLRGAYANPTFAADVDCNCSVDVQDFGGPTMNGPTDVFALWFGNWGADPTIPALDGFFTHLTGSDYLNIALTYGVSDQINFRGNYFDQTSQKTISDGTLSNLVRQSGLVAESNAIYFIFTAPDVINRNGIGDCGYHSDTGGLKYAWIGSNYGTGCGGATLAEATSGTASHELFETLTDPLVDEAVSDLTPPVAWYDGGPNEQGEVADICEDGPLVQVSLNGFESDVNPIFVRDPGYVSASGVRTGGYCASGNPLASASSVPEPGSGLLMTAGLAFMGLGVARRKVAASASSSTARQSSRRM